MSRCQRPTMTLRIFAWTTRDSRKPHAGAEFSLPTASPYNRTQPLPSAQAFPPSHQGSTTPPPYAAYPPYWHPHRSEVHTLYPVGVLGFAAVVGIILLRAVRVHDEWRRSCGSPTRRQRAPPHGKHLRLRSSGTALNLLMDGRITLLRILALQSQKLAAFGAGPID